jgi:hypothetical protein
MLNAKVRLLNFGGGQREFLALPIFLFVAPLFHNAPGFRFALSALRFQFSAFQHFSFLLHAQVSESSSATARSLLLGFAIAHSNRSQSSNVRWVCCWREVIRSDGKKVGTLA